MCWLREHRKGFVCVVTLVFVLLRLASYLFMLGFLANFGSFRKKRARSVRCCDVTGEKDTLKDLYERGVLIHRSRRKDYVERRVDGYEEPKEIFVVGTSHYSESSAEDVRKVIETVRPQCVVVELCRSRTGMMFENGTEMGISGESQQDFLKVIARSLRLGGANALLAQFLLARTGGKGAGLDFKAARIAAESVGAEVVLGDRPIEISLRRALAALELRDQLVLARVLLTRIFCPPKAEVVDFTSTLPDSDVIEAYLNALSTQFPALYTPLVIERDLYLTWSLKRSKAVNHTRRVVGVIGRAHLPGIAKAIDDDAGNDPNNPIGFKQLVAIPPQPPLLRRILVRLAIDTTLFLFALIISNQIHNLRHE